MSTVTLCYLLNCVACYITLLVVLRYVTRNITLFVCIIFTLIITYCVILCAASCYITLSHIHSCMFVCIVIFLHFSCKNHDWRYEVWKFSVIMFDGMFQYQLAYLVFSILGNYNAFFYALHLIDLVRSSPMLQTLLKSVTYNGTQVTSDTNLTSRFVQLCNNFS